ncbi:MAG: 1-acyl-sn-glycerol-3-phosphate acyltransferase, partial [Myxococcota bacterium]
SKEQLAEVHPRLLAHPPVMEAFYGLGFELLEGYGLTEAAPVLTCMRPGDKVQIGSVGRALPDIEVRIDQPDEAGVGEIVARGGNVMRGYWENPEATSMAIDEEGWLHTGDLGQMTRKGYVTIVGRKKDVIVSADGENVYPDELEEHLEGCPFVEELSVVGLPDGQGSERVAALMRPVEDSELGPDGVQAEIRRFVDVQNARMSYAQRIKMLRFTSEALPRTATRKVQRKEVVQILETMLIEERGDGDDARDEVWGEWTWLREQIADLAEVELTEVGIRSALSEDLSFDSLSFMELAGAVKEHTGQVVPADQLIEARTPEQIVALLDKDGHDAERLAAEATVAGFGHLPPSMRPQTVRRERPRPLAASFGDMTDLPEPVRMGLRGLLEQGQRSIYTDLFRVSIKGKAHIPYHSSAIVVANHSSHIDMGLVKHALKEWAPDLATLAAADYFFDTPLKRTYFGQLTNLIPMERSGSLDHSMGQAVRAVEAGRPLLLFPEGTRSVTGEVAPFRSGVGYLVMQTRQPVLPLFLKGTHRALPKGSVMPKRRKLEVLIGEPIPFEVFEPHIAGQSPKQAYATIATMVREAVLALKTGKRFLDPPEQDGKDEESNEAALIEGLFQTLGAQYQAHQIDTPVMYYFSLGNGAGGKWTVEVEPEQCRYWPGKPPHADCVVKTSTEIFRKMVRTTASFYSFKVHSHHKVPIQASP